MFTGIIDDIGEILSIDQNKDKKISIATNYDLSQIDIGASICCSGICLTVIAKENNIFQAVISEATSSCTTSGNWQVGQKINLERSLKFGSEIGGHLVTGHVDNVGIISGITKLDQSHQLIVKISEDIEYFIAKKGSIAIDGVSLTVNNIKNMEVEINLIPHTIFHTCFQFARPGDKVNVEIDMMARYIARHMEKSCK